MRTVTVRLGFVPSYRFRHTPWVQKMRDDSLSAFAQIQGLEVVAPQPSPEGQTPDPEMGQTADGMVHTLDEAEGIGDFFAREKVDGLILCPLDFGDERSAS